MLRRGFADTDAGKPYTATVLEWDAEQLNRTDETVLTPRISGNFGVYSGLSVARYIRIVEARGSNPLYSMKKQAVRMDGLFFSCVFGLQIPV